MTREEMARDLAASIDGTNAKPDGISRRTVDKARARPLEMEPGRAKATPKPLRSDGGPLKMIEEIARERTQHPGRSAEASEATLAPREPEVVSQDDRRKRQAQQLGISELYAAAAAARRAKEQVELLATVAAPLALDIARKGVTDTTTHLDAAGELRELGTSALAPVVEVWSVCTQFVMTTQRLLYRRETGIEALAKKLNAMQLPAGFKVESLAQIDGLAARSRRGESANGQLVIAIPFEQATDALTSAVDGFRARKNTTDPTPGPSIDAVKESMFFAPAAHRVEEIMQHIEATIAHTPTLDVNDPRIVQASKKYVVAAQRYADWAMQGTAASASAERVATASEGALRWANRPSIEVRTIEHAKHAREQMERSARELQTAWAATFFAQANALRVLEAEPEPEREVGWTTQLFTSIAKIGLATLIGGPAGAAGALAQTLVTGRGAALEGGIGNAVESATGELLGQLLEQRASTGGTATRKRFFETQWHALNDYQRIVGNQKIEEVIDEATRRPDGPELMKRAVSALERSSAQIAHQQRQRAVQDWATYQSRAVHGTGRAGGTDLVGTGGATTEGTNKLVTARGVPQGVLELFVSLNRGAPTIARARAGGLRPDEAASLSNLRVAGVTMPVQFVFHHDGGQVIVSRNERGVLWLRSAGPEGRRVLTAAFGGSPTNDDAVLHAAALLIADMGHLVLPHVEAA